MTLRDDAEHLYLQSSGEGRDLSRRSDIALIESALRAAEQRGYDRARADVDSDFERERGRLETLIGQQEDALDEMRRAESGEPVPSLRASGLSLLGESRCATAVRVRWRLPRARM